MGLADTIGMGSISEGKDSKWARNESTSDLLGGLLTDAKELAKAHGDHLKLEVRHEVHSLTETIKLAAIAVGAVVLAGLLIAHALALGLSALTGLPEWASYGIVGVVFAVVGYLFYRSRPPSVDLVPSEALGSIKRDAERVKNAISTDHHDGH
jgi:hypothetical protein